MGQSKRKKTVVFIVILICFVIGAIIACALITDENIKKWISLAVFCVATGILTCLQQNDLSVRKFFSIVLCSILIGAGPWFLSEIFKPGPPDQDDKTNITSSESEDPTPTPIPTPTPSIETPIPPDNNHAISTNQKIYDYYGRTNAKNVLATKKTISIGKRAVYKISTDMNKICRRFDLNTDGIIEFTFSKNEQDTAEIRKMDDWIVTIVENDSTVIYEGYINRNEDKSKYTCSLQKGNYILVIQRTTGNHTTRYINVDSSFLHND